MIHSKVMQLSDYNELRLEVNAVNDLAAKLGGWDPVQHTHRRWEYAMLLSAISHWVWTVQNNVNKPARLCEIADVGCGVGLSPALMVDLGANVSMYEPWTMGDETEKALRQVSAVGDLRDPSKGEQDGTYRLIRRPLCEMQDEDKNRYDIAICISTLEHIGECYKAWADLLSMVKPKGLVFITSDFAEDEEDHYQYANLRAGRMFNSSVYYLFAKMGAKKGFKLLDGTSNYAWSEESRLVNDYGFASLAMARVE